MGARFIVDPNGVVTDLWTVDWRFEYEAKFERWLREVALPKVLAWEVPFEDPRD